MKIIILVFSLFSWNALALEAVVTVLEAPMFKAKDYNSKVVQYLRKGDIIKVHPALANNRKYDDLAPEPGKLQELKKLQEKAPEWQDPLFKDSMDQTVFLEDEFIPAMDRQGNTVYVLSEHIYVYFNDSRELVQKIAKRDPTDYRLEEPLPKNYPLYSISGYRGQVLLGFSQPYNESYKYPDPIRAKSYSSPAQLYLGFLKRVDYDQKDRLYFGLNLNFKTHQNSYTFFDFRNSREHYIQLGLGPLLSYDAYKGEFNRINLSISVNFNPINYLTVTQGNGTLNEQRIYMAYNLASRLGLQYHRKQVIKDVDFVLGSSIDIESPATFQARNGGGQGSWWQNLGSDKYNTRGFFSLTGFAGFQTAY